MELMQNKICNKYIQVGKLNLSLSYFLQIFHGNLVFCLKIAEQHYTGSDRFLPVNAVMKGYPTEKVVIQRIFNPCQQLHKTANVYIILMT